MKNLLTYIIFGFISMLTFAESTINESLKPIDLQFDNNIENDFNIQLADFTPSLANAGATQKVAVLVDKPLYGHIANGISNYINGASSNLPFDINLYNDQEWSTQSFGQVRAFIKNIWQTEDIDGVILVGFFPHMRFSLPGQVTGGQIGMIGYEDLSGDFLDMGSWIEIGESYEFQPGPPDGLYDHHVWKTDGGSYNKWTDATLDIWCAIMRPFRAAKDSVEYTPEIIDQMTKYFDKLDRYYKAEMVVPRRGLSWANKDWGNQTSYLGDILKGNYGNNHVDQVGGSGLRNSGQDYMHKLGRGYEMCSYWSHSAGWYHNNDRWPWVDIQNYEFLNKKGRGSMITWGFNCHGSDYTETPTTGSMGQNYIFSGIGQVYISSAMSFGVSKIHDQMSWMIHNDLCAGETFRKAVEADYRENNTQTPYDKINLLTNTTIICQTFNGNPLLYTSEKYRISAAPATVIGSFAEMNQETECKIFKDQELFSYEYPASNGDFEFNFLEAGNYSVEVRTLGGLLIDTFEFDINEGEEKDLGLLYIGVAVINSDIWNYSLANSMPSGWTDVNADMSSVDSGDAPFGQQGDRGTYLEFNSRLYIRKTFVVNEQYATGPILLNIRSYKTTEDTGASINGQNITLATTGVSPDYWLLSADMADYLVPGTNVVIVWGANYLDASAPEYELNLKPHLAVSPQLYYAENEASKSLELYNTGTNQVSFSATLSENNNWLNLNTTSGTFSYISEIDTSVNRVGLDTGVYFGDIYIDAGIAGSATVTVAMAIGLDESLASADWDDSLAGSNPNGNWEYAYSTSGYGDFPYAKLPYHFQATDMCQLDYVWLNDFPNYRSKIGFATNDVPGGDLTLVVGNLSDKATVIGWRALEDGLVHAVRGYWSYPDPANPVKVNLDLVMENNQVQALYEYSATGMTTCGGAILSTSSFFVAENDIIYLTFSPNTETFILPPIKLLGDNCDLCVSFEPGVPEPIMSSLFFGILLLIYKFKLQ